MSSRFNTFKTIFKISETVRTNLSFWQPKTRSLTRQLSVAALALGVAACGSNEKQLQKGSVGFVSGFLGGVVADEPRAALVGRDILSSGGTAADAVSAMYFTMAVTLPSRAGLGGGGMCVAFDRASGVTEVLDFTATGPKAIPAGADRPSAVPANPRGFFALQARHGRLLWRQVITPAENFARFGHPTSRAFARDLAAIGPAVLADPGAQAMYASRTGSGVAVEGEKIEQLDLAGTLGMLRARGVGPFYTGPFATHFVESTQRAGGSLTIEELRDFRPEWRKTVRVKVGNEVAHFAPPPAVASSQAAVMLAMLIEQGQFDGGDEGTRAHLLAEIGAHAFADRETWITAKDVGALAESGRIAALSGKVQADRKTPLANLSPRPVNRHESPAATSFVAADAQGNAVACSVSMNASFGTGRVVAGTGVLLAAAPDDSGRGPTGLAPMLLINEPTKEFRMAAAASGGVVAPGALAGVVARIAEAGQTAKEAVNAPRVHNGGDPDVTYIEPTLDPAAQSRLATAGHNLSQIPSLGQVNVLYCPDGLPTQPLTCQMATDPRGAGLAAGSML
ncbi:gamma-glutamyltransferase [Magnetovibrio sp.]|uniref:gamma-glutamyltransferase n=1 Tax=Magnetovibrio sp. TaxID=2024836 RepID=UPI002F93F742